MVSAYAAIIIFAVIAILEPLLMLLGSKLIRRKSRSNKVKDGNYESAEESVGSRTSVMSEYLYYFPLFLSFEVVVVIMFIWAISAKDLAMTANYAILGLFIASFIFELITIMMARNAKE